MIHSRILTREDRPRIAALLATLDAFTADEQAVALELVDARLARPELDDYRFILSTDESTGRLAGYLCYGKTPMTRSTYDLYWIATNAEFARSGIARGLLTSLEADLAMQGGGTVRVETGSREGHGAAVRFYDGTGFSRAGLIEDFYAPGDDLIIYSKRVSGELAPPVVDIGEAGLIDAAFGYRDYANERDFLLACARELGARVPRRVLAWACGTGRHLSAFADAGVAGVGVDASENLLAYARRLLGARGSTPTVTFERAHLDERPSAELVDLSFVLHSAIHQLLTPAAIEAHLRQAARLLLPGGLHVIEATHPQDLTPHGSSGTEWSEACGNRVVDARFRMHLNRMLPSRVLPVTLEVVCSTKSRTRDAERQSMVQESQWFIPDVEQWRTIAAAVPELSLRALLGDFRVDVPFHHAAAWRLILVFQKT